MHLKNTARLLNGLFWRSQMVLSLALAGWGAEPVTDSTKPAEASAIKPTESVVKTFAWRKDPRFEKFVPEPALPQMITLEKTTLQIGADLQISLAVLTQMSKAEKDSLAKLFQVPLPVVTKFIEGIATKPQTDAEIFAKDLRAAITDYRFLVHVWNEFVSLEQDSPKREARQALAAGDVEKAWQLYPAPTANHPKPPPPQNLRIVSDSNSNKSPK